MRKLLELWKMLSIKHILIGIVALLIGILGWVWVWRLFNHWKDNKPLPNTQITNQTSNNFVSPYEIISGKASIVTTQPYSWPDVDFIAILKGKSTKIRLPQDIEIKFTGEIAIPKIINKNQPISQQVYLLNGKSHFVVSPQPSPFKVISRVGEILVLGTDFEAELQEQPPSSNENQTPGSNPAELKVDVRTGKVAVLAQGKKRPQPVLAGQNMTFMLQEIRLKNKIRAIGIGITPPNPQSQKLLQLRAAKTSLRANLQEFISGIEFKIKVKENSILFPDAEFKTEGIQNFDPIITKEQPIKNGLIIHGEVEMPRTRAEERRNCKSYIGQSAIYPEKSQNLGMAVKDAKSKAILAAINEAAFQIYGEDMPLELKGTFYPEYFSLQADKTWVAEISGEVLFN